MEEQIVPKTELPPTEIYRRNVVTMSCRQLRSHLARKARQAAGASPIEAAWAIVLREVYSNTERQVVDDQGKTMRTELEKTFGTLSPGLR